ncbi:uncharacterized protein LOC104896316 [Beta vulgaris subsp. vulgaris]|uniref:uncharacterized protein LOC104896316 n=1 Tax=Beta vulgaris subsp. vulgaris TaxID=3555 RepID=UPI002037275A|nr:uncharacterized protein LOC104896316 [Beta vulgaris subsp. vulgaris]
MYTTRPLSLYKKSPEAISIPPEGPNSGYLVIQDEESTPTSCFGLCKDPSINDLPFPQNKRLSIEFEVPMQDQAASYHSYDEVYLIPIINQPLSSHRYYAIKANGKRKGEAYASSKEEDKGTCCFCFPWIRDLKPRPFDPEDIYQQFEFSVTKTFLSGNMLLAKSVASDGHPPQFMRRKGWQMNTKSLKNSTLQEARGLDSSLRAHLPDFNFPVSQECSKSVIVGKWCCPFMFIKEGREKDQIKKSVFYEMTLQQRWERIFAADRRTYGQKKLVTVDVVVPTEMVRIAGQEAKKEKRNDDKGVVWFNGSGTKEHVGLSSLIIQRMMYEEERSGWVKAKEKQFRVIKDEKYAGRGEWRNFGCYLLVETFVLKRNDGSIVLTYDFRHTHQIRNKWESGYQ